MKTCERCQEQPAQVKVTEVGAEGIQTLGLCPVCARSGLSTSLAPAGGGKTFPEPPTPLAFERIKGYGFLRREGLESPSAADIYVSASITHGFGLVTGDRVSGKIRAPRKGERYYCLVAVSAVEHTQK